jgi:hypothetical protein
MTRFLGPPLRSVLPDGTDHFPNQLDALLNEVPQHFAGAFDPDGELNRWLSAIAVQIDQLSLAAEDIYADARLATATRDGLVTEWAFVYGLGNEIANLTDDQMRGYIESWIACDGSAQAIQNLLLAIVNLNPVNAGGPLLTFPGGGGGLTFDAGGAGVGPLYQYATPPDQTIGFMFPSDGSPLVFPGGGGVVFPDDGSGLGLASDGSGLLFPAAPSNLAFPNSAWVTLTEAFTTKALTVTVKSYLAFDRGAFKRAIDRFAQADVLWTYVESDT